MRRPPTAPALVLALGLVVGTVAAACGDDRGSAGAGGEPDRVTLVAYDSFPVDDPDQPDPIWQALDEFTAGTGIGVDLLTAGDTGTMVSKAVLTAGNPEGDVIWGIDNTFLSRAVAEGVLDPYLAAGVDAIAPELRALVPDGEATPVDFGDVCVNYDVARLAERGIAPPASLTDLVRPEYAGMLVVENPATSSPGLAFLLATIAEFGDSDGDGGGWTGFWEQLRSNDVLVVDNWTQAYYEEFSWAGGSRPLVVSYGSSPPFEMIYAPEPLAEPTTAVVESTCFRQIEFAGVLRGTDAPEAARRLVDFLVSERFQREIPLNLFVFPVDPEVELADEFVRYATIPSDPLTLDPALIDANRSSWIDEWTTIVGR